MTIREEMQDVLQTLQHPAYVINVRAVKRNLQIIDDVRRRTGITVLVALKAFTVPKVLRDYISPLFPVATVSSANESRIANKYMGQKAHAFSPAYTDYDIFWYLENCSHITFNSITQFKRLKKRLKDRNVSVGLRINPELTQVETDKYNPCLPGSRLGVPKDHLPEMLPAEINGLHCHALCESGFQEFERLLWVVENNFGSWLKQVKWLNMGGGHLITRDGYERDKFIRLVNAFRERWPNLELIIEPGSAFTWQTGVLVTRVQDTLKYGPDKKRIVLINASFAAHMPDCLEMPYKPTIWGAYSEPNEQTKDWKEVTIGGNTCLAGDYCGPYWFQKTPHLGDMIVFDDMAHYTMVKTNMFNGVEHPEIYLFGEDGRIRPCCHYHYEDYEKRMGYERSLM